MHEEVTTLGLTTGHPCGKLRFTVQYIMGKSPGRRRWGPTGDLGVGRVGEQLGEGCLGERGLDVQGECGGVLGCRLVLHAEDLCMLQLSACTCFHGVHKQSTLTASLRQVTA